MRYDSACMTGVLRAAETRLYGATEVFKNFCRSISLLSLLLLALSSFPLRAQQMTADVIGTVTDPAGAVLQGAKVTIRGLATGGVRTTVSDEHGEFGFNLLPIGHYLLKVEASGFKAHSVSDFEIHVGDRVRLSVQMTLGAATETIEVTGEAAALQTEESTVGNTLGGTTIQDLPLNGRNFMSMVDLTAGVQAQTTQANWSYLAGGRADDRRTGDAISANGKSDQLNNNEVDGFDNNDRAEGNIGLRPSMDGIQEVKVDTSSYTAENGRTAGAISNVITKSGGNSLHGSAYEYLRNDAFDSWDYFVKRDAAVIPKPELRLNEFGGSVGGPIRKDKTFFFADIEEDRLVQSIIYPVQFPSKQDLTPVSTGCYDFSDVGAGTICAGNAIAQNYWNLFPASRAVPVVNGGYPDVYFEPNKVQNTTTIDGRVDHQFNAHNLFFARYAYNPVSTVYPGPFPAAGGVFPNGNLQSAPGSANATAQQLQLTYTHIFNDHLIGELKAAYSRINIQAAPQNIGLSTPADQTLGFPAGTYNIPGIPSTNGMSSVNLGQNSDSSYLGDAPSEPFHNKSNNYQYAGTVTYTKGAHNFKFGASTIRRQIQFIQTGFPAAMFIIAGPGAVPFESLLEGQPTIVARMVELIQPLYETSEPSFYAMDNWRVTNSLTLNLGLRYEIFTPYSEASNRYTNFDLSTLDFIAGGKIGVKTDYKDFSPRVGFTKSLGAKTVVRGAFGMSYFPSDVGNVAGGPNLVQMENPPYFFNYFSNPGPGGQCVNFEYAPGETDGVCPPGPPGFPPSTMVGLPVPQSYSITATGSGSWQNNSQISQVYAKDPNLRSSYLEQYNLSLQREFGANSVTLAYVGDIGQALLRQTNATEPMPVACPEATVACAPPSLVINQSTTPGTGIGPNIATVTHFYNGASEHYDALQVVFNRKVAKGLGAGANYVWAHALTDATFGRSNTTAGILSDDRQYDYGNSDLDVRQRVTFHASYNLPFAASSHGVAAVLAKGWQANALGYWQTGMPVTVTSGATTANRIAYINLPNVQSDRPNSTGKTKLSGANANEWFNANAFTAQAIGTPGSEGVNQVVGPTDRRLDFSIDKDFALRENLKVQFRAECFNLTNTENYNAPNLQLTSWNSDGTPGTSNGFGAISSSAFSENPRQYQFALKLLF